MTLGLAFGAITIGFLLYLFLQGALSGDMGNGYGIGANAAIFGFLFVVFVALACFTGYLMKPKKPY